MARGKTTAIATYDKEFAEQAKVAKEQEASAALGRFFSLRAGRLSFNKVPVPGNRVAVVILDHVLERVWYDKPFDASSPSSPPCYAFGRGTEAMAPHPEAPDKQSLACDTCAKNAWGSKVKSDGTKSRGKACSERRRLALVHAGEVDGDGNFTPIEDPEHFRTAQVAYLNVPVTSVKGFASYVHQTAELHKRPPHGVFTVVTVVPDPVNQIAVEFENRGKVPPSVAKAILDRHAAQQGATIFPYPVFEDDGPRGRASKPAARGAKPARRGGGF